MTIYLDWLGQDDAPSGFLWFFASFANADGSVAGPPLDAREYFDTFLASPPAAEDFEGFADFDNVDGLVGSSNGNSFTMSQDSGLSVIFGNAQGRFNTTPAGAKHADIDFSGANPTLTFSFDTPVSAFACYITDLGEFGASITATIYRTGGGTDNYQITGAEIERGLTFWGFLDGAATYDAVVFETDNIDDRIGIDDVILATHGQLK